MDLATDNLSREIEQLASLASDWAGWDEAYTFMESRDGDFVRSNLTDSSFIRLKLNFILYLDSGGNIAAGKGFDLAKQEEALVPQSLTEHLAPGRTLLKGATGVLLLPEGPLLVASHPVLTSREQGPSRGTLVMARRLDSVQVRRLAELTHLSLSVERYVEGSHPFEPEQSAKTLSSTPDSLIRAVDNDTMEGFAVVPDVYGTPAIILKVEMSRNMHREGIVAARFYIFSLGGMFVLLGCILFFVLAKWCCRPWPLSIPGLLESDARGTSR